jgi:hypothetical protein
VTDCRPTPIVAIRRWPQNPGKNRGLAQAHSLKPCGSNGRRGARLPVPRFFPWNSRSSKSVPAEGGVVHSDHACRNLATAPARASANAGAAAKPLTLTHAHCTRKNSTARRNGKWVSSHPAGRRRQSCCRGAAQGAGNARPVASQDCPGQFVRSSRFCGCLPTGELESNTERHQPSGRQRRFRPAAWRWRHAGCFLFYPVCSRTGVTRLTGRSPFHTG